MIKTICARHVKMAIFALALIHFPSSAWSEIDGHGPDAWRVTGVSSSDMLNARMGPGTTYPVIEKFAHNERGMQQITCVPFYTAAHYQRMSEAQINALPQRWCLMRNKSMSKAGWVAQRFITPDDAIAAAPRRETSGTGPKRSSKAVRTATSKASPAKPANEPYATSPDVDLIGLAEDLIREIYERQYQSENSDLPSAFDPSVARNYFTDDIAAWLASGAVDSHPLYGAQDFDGSIGEPTADPASPMAQGMVPVSVDFTNFGTKQRVVFYIRPDTSKSGMPLRVFHVEHEGWSYP